MAIRAILIQSSTSTIANYANQTSLLPFHTLDLLEQVNKQFIWGELDGARELHTVAGYKVCKSKDRRGLDLRQIKEVDNTT